LNDCEKNEAAIYRGVINVSNFEIYYQEISRWGINTTCGGVYNEQNTKVFFILLDSPQSSSEKFLRRFDMVMSTIVTSLLRIDSSIFNY